MQISTFLAVWLALCIIDVQTYPNLHPHPRKSLSENELPLAQNFDDDRNVTERLPDIISHHPLLPRADVETSATRQAVILTHANEQDLSADLFRDGPRRPHGSPKRIQLPPPPAGIPRKLRPFRWVDEIGVQALGMQELGANGYNRAGASTARPIITSNMNGQGAIFLFGRTRATRTESTGRNFVAAARFDLFSARWVNAVIEEALRRGTVATVAIVVPYLGADIDIALDEAREYARSIEAAMLVVFPGIKVAPLMAYPYTEITRSTPGVRLWNFQADVAQNVGMASFETYVARKDFPRKRGWMRDRLRAMAGCISSVAETAFGPDDIWT